MKQGTPWGNLKHFQPVKTQRNRLIIYNVDFLQGSAAAAKKKNATGMIITYIKKIPQIYKSKSDQKVRHNQSGTNQAF